MFSEPVSNHTFVLRSVPLSEPGQEPMRISLTCQPGCRLSETFDGQGNKVFLGSIENKHTFFSFCSTGEVLVDSSQRSSFGAAAYYRYPTQLTTLTGTLKDYFEANKVEGAPIALAEYWLTKIGAALGGILLNAEQKKIAVTVDCPETVTAAHEAWELGAGVCQDFAHILLAFLRAQNVICRYVAGLTTGEGASHAWVEVFDGETWIGVDPTHQRFCDDNYVKISQGPDFSFCALERGVFMGAADQSMSAKCKLGGI